MSSRSARATSSRWSWPPESWCGYLFRQSPAFRLTASSALSTFASHSPRDTRGKKPSRIISKTRSALKIGLYELNGSWKTPCTRR